MNDILKKVIAGVAILILGTSAYLIIGHSGQNDSELGPEEIVECFYNAITAGDFDTAENLCSTADVAEYLNHLRKAWEGSGNSIRNIAPAILAETEITFDKTEKDGQERTVYFKLTSAEGKEKKKTARLGKEEGEWKIQAITDRN